MCYKAFIVLPWSSAYLIRSRSVVLSLNFQTNVLRCFFSRSNLKSLRKDTITMLPASGDCTSRSRNTLVPITSMKVSSGVYYSFFALSGASFDSPKATGAHNHCESRSKRLVHVHRLYSDMSC
ncbi:hypothetical protein C7974DRAFT_172108 [Boeremia exigua]|uniref:uncharacterized protein n=1 Tax=Boeremia exigua TaxID=749465 RepID=UPI001E8DFF37|nr:uncharacterized protein C7974DRAFT_172108 [Boeremia exigua]KAH6633464.1 hypothetical protein C7974DRAFT_172108 [Boeremia exigua]